MGKFQKKLPKRKLNKKPIKKTEFKPKKVSGLRKKDFDRIIKSAKIRDEAFMGVFDGYAYDGSTAGNIK